MDEVDRTDFVTKIGAAWLRDESSKGKAFSALNVLRLEIRTLSHRDVGRSYWSTKYWGWVGSSETVPFTLDAEITVHTIQAHATLAGELPDMALWVPDAFLLTRIHLSWRHEGANWDSYDTILSPSKWLVLVL